MAAHENMDRQAMADMLMDDALGLAIYRMVRKAQVDTPMCPDSIGMHGCEHCQAQTISVDVRAIILEHAEREALAR